MAQPPEFRERRSDTALRALYHRVEALENENTELSKEVAVLKEGAVTKGWLIGGILSLSVAAIAGAQSFRSGLEESAAKPIARLAAQVEQLATFQADTRIKTEALYLERIERKPLQEVREAVLRKEQQNGR